MSSNPPQTYSDFVERFPQLGEAWDLLREGGKSAGPLDQRTQLLVKLGIAIGAQRTGAVSSATRKALKGGVTMEEIEQVVALAASTIGMPGAVASFQWSRNASRKVSEGKSSSDT